MNPVIKTLLATAIALFSLPLFSQNIIGQAYLFNTSETQWQQFDNARIVMDGTAESVFSAWITGDRIQSTSLGNAALLWGEESMSLGRLRSPFQDFTGEPEVYLSFHQYYRNGNGNVNALVDVRVLDDGVTLSTIPLNTLLNANVRTANYDTVILDLSAIIASATNSANIQIEFRLEGEASYWLLDDVTFYDEIPYPDTNPTSLGDHLADNGYPYEVESTTNGANAYVPYELVVQFKPTTSLADRVILRESIGAFLKDSCVCNKLELWVIDGSEYFDPAGQNPAGGTTNILANKIGGGSSSEVDGVDLNYYNAAEYLVMPPIPNDTLTTDSISHLNISDASAIRIAILDTGIDYYHPDVRDFVARRPDILGDSIDNNLNCYVDDPIGWNFVDRNNNPFDDHEHGTHVAGIIADSLRAHGIDDSDYEFIPYKTHDHNGVSTLFAVACATYQSIKDEVNLINDSWGFFGDSSVVLRNAVDAAALEDILILSAAGNDNIWMDTLQQFPACYTADNLLTVGATMLMDDSAGVLITTRAEFSNYDRTYVDLMARGVGVFSAVPGGVRKPKDGTSMATPMVTAAAARAIHLAGGAQGSTVTYENARDCVLSWTSQESTLQNFANNGRLLGYGQGCVNGTETPIPIEDSFSVYPNPMSGSVVIMPSGDRRGAIIRLFHASGQLVYETEQTQWYANEPYRLDFPTLPAGIYFLQVEGADYLWTGKLLKI